MNEKSYHHLGRSSLDNTYLKKLHDVLNHIKNSEASSDYDKFKNVIRFVYGPAYNEIKLLEFLLKREIIEAYGYGAFEKVSSQGKSLYSHLVGIDFNDSSDSSDDMNIVNYLEELSNEKDEHFRKVFFDATDTIVEMFNDGIYLKNSDSMFIITNYLINLYIMLSAYHHNKDNFDNFKAIVDDVKNIFINIEWTSLYVNFEKAKETYNKIVSIRDYYRLEKLRKTLIKSVSSFSDFQDYQIHRIDEIYLEVTDVYSDVKSLEDDGYSVSDEVLLTVISDIINTYESPEWYYKGYRKELLIGDRYNYLNKKLEESENRPAFRADMWKYLDDFDYELFEFLNKTLGLSKDSFMTCMDIVFDSDTYKEFINKADFLKNVASLYKENPIDAIELYIALINMNFKDSYLGVELAYPSDYNSKLEKPKQIFERMLDVYSMNNINNAHYLLSVAHEKEKTITAFYSFFSNEKAEEESNSEEKHIEGEKNLVTEAIYKKPKKLNLFLNIKK